MPGKEGTNDERFVTVTVGLGGGSVSSGLTLPIMHYHSSVAAPTAAAPVAVNGPNWDVVQGYREGHSRHQRDCSGKLNSWATTLVKREPEPRDEVLRLGSHRGSPSDLQTDLKP